MEELKALIPLIPTFISGCQAIWPFVKTIFSKYNYPNIKELEERVINLQCIILKTGIICYTLPI